VDLVHEQVWEEGVLVVGDNLASVDVPDHEGVFKFEAGRKQFAIGGPGDALDGGLVVLLLVLGVELDVLLLLDLLLDELLGAEVLLAGGFGGFALGLLQVGKLATVDEVVLQVGEAELFEELELVDVGVDVEVVVVEVVEGAHHLLRHEVHHQHVPKLAPDRQHRPKRVELHHLAVEPRYYARRVRRQHDLVVPPFQQLHVHLIII